MRGINNQPYIDLDQYVDAAGFNALRYKIYAGLSKCKYKVSNYFRTDDEFLEKEYANRLEHYIGKPLVPMYIKHNELMNLYGNDEMRIEYEKLTGEQKRSYLMFVGASQPYHSHYLFDNGEWSDDTKHFPELMEWIHKLPFTSISLVQFYIVDSLNPTVVHKDVFIADDETHTREFVWLCITPGKNFYIYDHLTDTRYDVKSTACFFNERDFHGGDPSNHTTLSLKIWGKFNDDIREKLSLRGTY